MRKIAMGCLLAVIFTVTNSFSGSAQTKNFIDQPYIEMEGEYDTLITPNEIYVSISISERDTRDRVSVEELEAKMIVALQGLGINTEKDITIKGLESKFQYYLLKSKDILKSKQYTVKLRDPQLAVRMFIELEKLNISNVSIERVGHSDIKNIRNSCRAKAIEDARNRARTLTNPISQTIGPAIHIAEKEVSYKSGIEELSNTYSYNLRKEIDEVNIPRLEFNKLKVYEVVIARFILNLR